MRYFKYFPKIKYDLDNNKQTREIVDVFRLAKIVNQVDDDISFYRLYTIQEGERPDHVSQNLYKTPDYYWTFFFVNSNLKNLYVDWPLTFDEMNSKIEEEYSGEYLKVDSYDLFDQFVLNETITGLQSGATAVITDKNPTLGWIRIKDRTGSFNSGELIFQQVGDDIYNIQIDSTQGPFKFAPAQYVFDDEVVNRDTPNAAIVTYSDLEIEKNDAKREIRVIRPEFVDSVKRQFREAINA